MSFLEIAWLPSLETWIPAQTDPKYALFQKLVPLVKHKDVTAKKQSPAPEGSKALSVKAGSLSDLKIPLS